MTLKLKTVERGTMDKKVQDNQKQEKSQMETALERENQLLKEQLDRLSSDQESLKLEKEAERLKKEEEALKEEANLKKILGESFGSAKAQSPDQDLSQSQLLDVMADAVGHATEANSKLILSKVASLISEFANENKKTQELVFKLAGAFETNQAASEFDDYNEYRDDIATIRSKTRGLSAKDAYMLARARRQGNQPPADQMRSERPNTPPSPSSVRDDYTQSNEDRDSQQQANPRLAFRAAAEAAIDKVIASRQR